MTDTAHRAALYERVSTGTQDSAESRSVEQQNEAGTAAATEHGWRVVDRYPDPGLSASRFAKKGRPEWQRLMADIRDWKIDVVVLWEPSRGGRELEEWAAFLSLCRQREVSIYAVSQYHLYDPRNARDWRTLAEEGVDSAYESEKISLRTRRGTAASAQRGDPYGRVAYGYVRRYEYVSSSRKPKVHQEPHPEQAPVVREIITSIAASKPISRIISDLAERGVPSPTGRPRWAGGTIARIVLEGVVYIAKRRYNGGPLLDGNWPALVDEDVYWKAVTVLQDPRRRPANGSGIRPGRSLHLLSYIAVCDVCEGPLSMRHKTRAGSRQVAYYRCARKGCVSAPMDWLDFLVTEAVIALCSQPSVYQGITETDDREAQAARDEAQSERARLETFEAQAVAGTLSASSFAKIAAGIETRVAELEARAEQLAAPPALRDLVSTDREADIRERWEGMPIPARRNVVRELYLPRLGPAGTGERLSPWRVKMVKKFDNLLADE
jgi:DNA invertase Pin-like site-specific DNA recombinase